MVKPAVISRNLLIVAALSLLVCCDAVFWHIMPLGYEGMLAYGALSFLFGLALTVVALGFATFSLVRYGNGDSRVVILGCGVLLFISFAVVAAFSAGMKSL